MPIDDEAWLRLKSELRDRRVDLGYPQRKPFLDYKGVAESQQRLMAALENAERDNYDEDTLRLAEKIYEWEHGSIGKVLAGEQPTPIADEPTVRRVPQQRTADRLRREIRGLVNRLPAHLLLRVRDDLRKMVPEDD